MRMHVCTVYYVLIVRSVVTSHSSPASVLSYLTSNLELGAVDLDTYCWAITELCTTTSYNCAITYCHKVQTFQMFELINLTYLLPRYLEGMC